MTGLNIGAALGRLLVIDAFWLGAILLGVGLVVARCLKCRRAAQSSGPSRCRL